MAEQLTPQERLQPALLDRLTDDEPDKKQELRENRVLSKSRLRQAVLRDLAWLFNATRLETSRSDMSHVPDARRSVINFGLPAHSGQTASSLDIQDLERDLKQAILDYEPRILPETLEVHAIVEVTTLDRHNVLGIQIQGQLWAQPVPLELLIRTEIDLETGKVQIADLAPLASELMDPRLLQYYNLELQHLREMGAEFAQQFPKIAARLGMNGLEVADPYVERLIEGVAFLASRVQLKLDAEFPRFTQALLEIVHPHYLAPTPSMLVAQLRPDPGDTNLASGLKIVPRGSTMLGLAAGEDATPCEFRTAQDVTLWPIEIASASYFSFAPDLPLNRLSVAQRIKGGVRIRLKTTAGLKFAQVALDRLPLFVSGRDDVANKLCELCLASPLGVLVIPGKGPASSFEFLPPSSVRHVGFADTQALLPVTARSFQGYRLLQEYFSFPHRYRFLEISGLAPAVARTGADEIELVVLLGRGESTLERVVDATNFALFCTPAINLFSKRVDRINVSDGSHEYHVVADRTRPLDFEIYQVTAVTGHGIGSDSEQQFLPFYDAYSSRRRHGHAAYYTVRREPRLPSSSQKRRGPRSSYIGSEVFLSLVDPSHAPFSGDLRQLSVEALCTNRDLVLQMPMGVGKSDCSLDIAAPVTSIRVISGPSRPYAPLADGSAAWRAISHLSLNYLSLVNSTAEEGATGLRELLQLYALPAEEGMRRQVDGIRSVKIARVVRRLREPGPLAFGRGLEIDVSVDELAFEGASAFLLGAVLDRYFARHVSLNAFTETVLRSEGRGEINRWVPQWGARPTL